MSISIDPASAAPLQEAGPRAFLEWARHAGLLLPNAEEAAVLTGARDPEAAAWALARDGREVVITLGAGGALWSDGEHVERAPASPAPAKVSTDRRGRRVHGGLARLAPAGSGADGGAGGGELRRRAGAGERARADNPRPGADPWSRVRPRAGRAEDLDAVLGGHAR